MTKNTYILAFLLCSILSYGQQVTFHENTNYRANVLHQSLDEDGKHLLLESKTEQITKVDIFNNDFSEIIDVYSNNTKIDINILPLGNFVIQARIGQKRIIMYLEKSNDVKIAASNQKEVELNINNLPSQQISNKISKEKNEDVKIASSDQKVENTVNKGVKPSTIGNVVIADNEKHAYVVSESNKITKKNNSSFYWVVSESNSGFGSSKSMRLEYKEDVAKLISKVKLELKSNVGKNNILLVYEVYNRSKFMTKQLRNSVYYKTEKSNFFNVVPIYASNE
ncbi:hypothetical protein [Psychroserpens sp.]